MRQLDWPAIFRERGVAFAEHGKNVRKGNYAIRCPWCGPRDPSHHLNVNPKNGMFSCFRDASHAGRRPERLLVALGYTWAAATALVGEDPTPDGTDFRQRFSRLDTREDGMPIAKRVVPPPTFKLLSLRHDPHIHHLTSKRGYAREELPGLLARYQLLMDDGGRWRNRVVFPLFLDGRLSGWTGRALGRLQEPRYDAFVPDPSSVWNEENCNGGEALIICEGPFDALKADWVGHGLSVNALAVMGLRFADAKVSRIVRIAERYNRIAFLLDGDGPGAMGLMRALDALAHLRPTSLRLPEGVDPDEFGADNLRDMFLQLLRVPPAVPRYDSSSPLPPRRPRPLLTVGRLA